MLNPRATLVLFDAEGEEIGHAEAEFELGPDWVIRNTRTIRIPADFDAVIDYVMVFHPTGCVQVRPDESIMLRKGQEAEFRPGNLSITVNT